MVYKKKMVDETGERLEKEVRMILLALFAMFVAGFFVGGLVVALFTVTKIKRLEAEIEGLKWELIGKESVLKDKTTEFKANVGLLRGEALLFRQDVNKLLHPHGWAICDEDGFRKLKKTIKEKKGK